DGLLYWALGDGGGANDGLDEPDLPHGPMGHGQNIKSPLGAVLRIDVDSEPDEGRPYAIPPGNLFADGSGAGETYAYGFRNPYRFSFDDGPGGDGALYVADVGQDQFEEIDIVVAGGNYGWVLREGFDCFDPFNPGTSPATCDEIGLLGEPLLDPVLVYDHSVGLAVIGGFVYRGTGYPPLQGKYVFGDFSQDFGPTGRLFYTDIEGASAYELREFFIAPDGEPLGRALFGIGEDEDGEVYVLASGSVGPVGDSGVVYRIVPPA
ncbi:MAG: PQQ-dependent sugar dehydrogenase, partial [Planctomycetota bacterium]